MYSIFKKFIPYCRNRADVGTVTPMTGSVVQDSPVESNAAMAQADVEDLPGMDTDAELSGDETSVRAGTVVCTGVFRGVHLNVGAVVSCNGYIPK